MIQTRSSADRYKHQIFEFIPNTDKLDAVIVPTFNVDDNVDAPETSKLLKIVLLKMVVDVAFKSLINNIEFVDNEFKYDKLELRLKEFIIFNNVVGVAFKLLIGKVKIAD